MRPQSTFDADRLDEVAGHPLRWRSKPDLSSVYCSCPPAKVAVMKFPEACVVRGVILQEILKGFFRTFSLSSRKFGDVVLY